MKRASVPVAALYLGAGFAGSRAAAAEAERGVVARAEAPGIVDTNVHLFDWPFRRLKYRETGALVGKLRGHRIEQAWAGSFEALLHKDLDGVNARLAEECAARGDGLLVPFGSVNPVWPDWEEDLRRCGEGYGMPGIRLYPGYHGYALEHPDFRRLLEAATERGMIVQIALEMEDSRVHHPVVDAPDASAAALPGILREIPGARVQVLNGNGAIRSRRVSEELREAGVAVEISSLEGVGAVGKLLAGNLVNGLAGWPVERVLFGSHAPFFPVENGLLKLFESPLSREQMVAVMRGNARRLLERGGAS